MARRRAAGGLIHNRDCAGHRRRPGQAVMIAAAAGIGCLAQAWTGDPLTMRPSIHSLQLFVAVVEEGSISAAAEREHMAQSALSKRMSELERVIGTPLLHRRVRGVEPTAAGEVLVRGARALLHYADNLAIEVREFAEGVSGYVRLAANLSSITQFLARDISEFSAAHPCIKIEVEERVSSVVTQMVLDNTADIGIFNESSDELQLDVRPYRRDMMVMAAPHGHPLAGREPVAFVETLDYDHVGMHKGSAANFMLMRAATAASRPLRMRFHVTSYDAMVSMIKAGLGIGLMPYDAMSLYDTSNLATIRLSDSWAHRQLKLCTRPGDSLTAAGRLLLEHLASRSEAGQGEPV